MFEKFQNFDWKKAFQIIGIVVVSYLLLSTMMALVGALAILTITLLAGWAIWNNQKIGEVWRAFTKALNDFIRL